MKARSPALLGGRSLPRQRSSVGLMLFVWVPVTVMLLVIARESTAAFGSVNTSPVFRAVYEAVFGRVPNAAWESIHHHIRKTGHFIGYGLLGLSLLRAFLYMWMRPMQHRPAWVWRRWCLQMAICCTALVASLDEVHQSYIPDRTGLVTDVLLDTSGALVLSLVCAGFWLRRKVRNVEFERVDIDSELLDRSY